MSADTFPLYGQPSERFLSLARQPQNIGSLDDPSGKGIAVGECGDSVEVFLRVEKGVISDIRVIPHGCVYTLVCSSAMSLLAKGRDLDRALDLEPQEVVETLGGLPEDHMHCARLAVNTLGEAIADYYKKAAGSK